MNIIDNIKLNLKYKELKKLITDRELLQQMLSNKNFKKKYNSVIKKFIKDLKWYGSKTGVYVDYDTIINHLKCILEVSDKSLNIDKYVSYVNEDNKQTSVVSNPQVVVDDNFKQLHNLIGSSVFSDNIDAIVRAGYSGRLLEFSKNYPNLKYIIYNLKPSVFQDSVWNIIKNNPKIGNTTVLEYFSSNDKMDLLVQIINDNLFEGFKYTYENVPNSHRFFMRPSISLKQLDIKFINNVGNETLNLLYKVGNGYFYDKEQYSKIFKIADCGNYELIRDIVELREIGYFVSFKNIPDSNVAKNILEAQNSIEKKQVFLYKYLGIDWKERPYIKLFLQSIIRVKWSDDFKEKYSDIIKLINIVMNASDQEVIEIGKSFNTDKRDEYEKLIKDCEIEGNTLIKCDFSNTLRERSNQIQNNANHKVINTETGQNIDVYELDGQPFTMLVHVVGDNRHSPNNQYVQEIVDNPANWENINRGNQHISTSLISEQYMMAYGDPAHPSSNNKMVVFGFDDVSPDSIKMTDISDSGINRDASTDMNYNMRNRFVQAEINTVAPVDYLMKKTKEKNRTWNEVVLPRIDERTGQKRKPNYILCMDYISDASIRAAEYFNIPIYLINKAAYISQNINSEEMDMDTASKSR